MNTSFSDARCLAFSDRPTCLKAKHCSTSSAIVSLSVFPKSAPNNTAFKMVMCVLEQFYCCTQIVFSLGGREESETIIIQKEKRVRGNIYFIGASRGAEMGGAEGREGGSFFLSLSSLFFACSAGPFNRTSLVEKVLFLSTSRNSFRLNLIDFKFCNRKLQPFCILRPAGLFAKPNKSWECEWLILSSWVCDTLSGFDTVLFHDCSSFFWVSWHC